MRSVKVNWNFVPQPLAPPMRTFKSGQSIRADVHHVPFAESDGKKILRVFCYGCHEFFKNYHSYLWRHGLCKEKPKGRK